MIYKFKNNTPTINTENCFIAHNATIIGDVTLGNNISIWFNAVVRGDEDKIVIGDNTNIQDGCVLHVDHNFPLQIGKNVTVGHKAILHGCTIGDQCLIGMNAVVLDRAVIGKNCIIGANALVGQGKTIPDNSLVVGSPGRIMRQVSDDEVNNFILRAAQLYADLIPEYKNNLKSIIE